MGVMRALAGLVMVGFGAAAFLALSPTAPDTKTYELSVRAALADADASNDTAEGAPQQQVVNGWVARDLLAVLSSQSNDQLQQQARTNQLLLVMVLTGAVLLVTGAGGRAATASTPTEQGHEVPTALP